MVHISHKWPHYRNGQWKLHYNNIQQHIAQHVPDFLTLHGVEVIPRTPYSADLTPCNFFLFPTGKRDLKGRQFECPQVVYGTTGTAFKRYSKHLKGAIVNTE